MAARELTCEVDDVLDIAGTICMAEDDGNDDLNDDNTDPEDMDPTLDESNGVHSDAGGSPLLVRASRLQTGQKVLHAVSQESTQAAWNSVEKTATRYLGMLGRNMRKLP